ncbi:isocitrate/isopropylmalate dehydrogenase family protein [Acuticoccus sp. I52.16.1]|uniref:isocitrate/isopropylmalate dehydrogenase family protein n=1 Tax=Acuticoccus sp. I52.16.1 TaxID=2928472 RepID=UPI001FD58B69|nr:isocitrate/isopropylmalate family dehydrogenase [Acuticoccus sp. I52.16.1]UOM36833.1 isocitrate/isopropylmalate family dehydrogenase [Acuticoccus sp. I52.16.1]
MAGDGIGQEVTPAALAIADAALARTGGVRLVREDAPAGAAHYQSTGEAFPETSRRTCEAADAIYLGAMGLPSVRYADGTEIAPQLDLRFMFELYAGVRPTRAIPGVRPALADPRAAEIDFVLVRESTEGLFASRGKGVVEDDAVARETMVITRRVSERVFGYSFGEAERRRAAGKEGRLTLIDKANVFTAFAFFRKVFDEVAARHPDVAADHLYVDAAALAMVSRPWALDVAVTENMFGDILSDLAAGLVGGMGYAPSADIGDERAVFQPAHGSAPDIAGTGKANPVAAILSAAMMLDWLGARHGEVNVVEAGRLIGRAVDAAFADGGLVTCELGGTADTRAVTDAVLANIR